MSLKDFDDSLRERYATKHLIGSDEAGRGAWAGPLVGAAVCFDSSFDNSEIRDSKLIKSHEDRMRLSSIIKSKALSWYISIIDSSQIDSQGLTYANKYVLEYSCKKVEKNINQECVFVVDQSPASNLHPLVMMPKADNKSLVVAAASILAKTTRDNIIFSLNDLYPDYCFDKHKGYINSVHVDLVKIHGLIKGIHRFSYKVNQIEADIATQLNLFDVS